MSALSPFLRSAEGGYLFFWCPGCRESHMIRVASDGGSGWGYNGDPERPTFTPSVLVRGKRRITDEEAKRIMSGEKVEVPDRVCHTFVTDGRIQFLGDCTHDLAGRTVDLPPFQEDADD